MIMIWLMILSGGSKCISKQKVRKRINHSILNSMIAVTVNVDLDCLTAFYLKMLAWVTDESFVIINTTQFAKMSNFARKYKFYKD